MRVPSGEKTGKLSRGFEVSLRSAVPSRFAAKMPEPRRENTRRLPRRATAGDTAGSAPVVICWRPVPSTPTRNSCWGPAPSGCAEKTIQLGDGAPDETTATVSAIISTTVVATGIDHRRKTIPESNTTLRRLRWAGVVIGTRRWDRAPGASARLSLTPRKADGGTAAP